MKAHAILVLLVFRHTDCTNDRTIFAHLGAVHGSTDTEVGYNDDRDSKYAHEHNMPLSKHNSACRCYRSLTQLAHAVLAHQDVAALDITMNLLLRV